MAIAEQNLLFKGWPPDAPQEKPYYGAANIVQALGAMRGNKLDPEAYQKALGGAHLLDIFGFASALNK